MPTFKQFGEKILSIKVKLTLILTNLKLKPEKKKKDDE